MQNNVLFGIKNSLGLITPLFYEYEIYLHALLA